MKTEFELKGKCALVTGGTKRLGKAICLALAEKGVNLLVHYNTSRAEADDFCKELRGLGVNALSLVADLSKKADYETLVERANRAAGPIDILVNNASIFPSGTLLTMNEDNFIANLTVNAFAPLVISRAFAAQSENGVVINMLDARIVEYDRAHAAYHASKRMLATLTRMTALEFAPRVRVNAVAPGLILPPEGEEEAYFTARVRDVPLERHGGVQDVTRAVLFLIESSFVTGEIVFVDGGQRMKGDVYGF
jgi:NAD(P)-dependent dehydrogenase (short-subunit alcohol dehydrogenase family)